MGLGPQKKEVLPRVRHGIHQTSEAVTRHTSRTQVLIYLVANEIKHGVAKDLRADKANQWPSIGPHAAPRGATRTADHADKIRSNCRDLTVK